MMKKIQTLTLTALSLAVLSAGFIPGSTLPAAELSGALSNSFTRSSLPLTETPCSASRKLSSLCRARTISAGKETAPLPALPAHQPEQSFTTTNRTLASYRAYPITPAG